MKDGYMLNPDDEFVSNLKKKIKSNGKYCQNKERGVADNKCPCRIFRETGECECGLYVPEVLEFNWGDEP